MRKAINGTLKILTISSVIVSMLLILVAYCTQYSIKEKSDLKSRTNILAQCLDGYDENSEINILTKMYDDVSDIRVTLIKSDGTVIYDNEADTTTMENRKLNKPLHTETGAVAVIPKRLVKKYIIMP